VGIRRASERHGTGPSRPGPVAWFADNSGRDSLDGDSLWAVDKRGFEPRLMANHNGPHRVAQKLPNAFGLYDMLGNVVEYTADWFDIRGYAAGTAVDPAQTAPVRPNGGHSARGGHWAYPGGALRVSKRFFGADEGSPVGGFRCALPAK
jgi:formylglycine-generating enzyme required for sulfatase activity